jgi:hypothetical protein
MVAFVGSAVRTDPLRLPGHRSAQRTLRWASDPGDPVSQVSCGRGPARQGRWRPPSCLTPRPESTPQDILAPDGRAVPDPPGGLEDRAAQPTRRRSLIEAIRPHAFRSTRTLPYPIKPALRAPRRPSRRQAHPIEAARHGRRGARRARRRRMDPGYAPGRRGVSRGWGRERLNSDSAHSRRRGSAPSSPPRTSSWS